jgi:hypothetical protein
MAPDLANNSALTEEKVQEDNCELYLFHSEPGFFDWSG